MHPFRRAAETKDLDAMREVLREDVVLHSPILFKGFEGRDLAIGVLTNVIATLEDFSYVAEAREGDVVFLHFQARVGDRELEGIDLLELDSEDRVAELTVFMRPLSAVNRFNEAMSARLQAAGLSPGSSL